ncbi:MAG: fused MFS/spermidine synthase, partial [Nanoarchaeota archaeon]|nr:fused MFS/spermidine synthase [Nanoarchaeota archaeon]
MKKIFFGSFIIGFLSLCYEIIATKIFFAYFSENSQSVAIIISIFLLGLSIGAFLYGKYNKKINLYQDFFFYSNIFCGFYFYIILSNSNLALYFFKILNELSYLGILKISLSIVYLLIPTIFLGFYFPFFLTQISKLYKKNNLNEKLSLLYFFDLIGSVIGSLITGFLFIPFFGIKKTLI